MKVRFDIDGTKGGAEYEWDWKPVSGNMMYAMPEKGNTVRIYFSTEKASEGTAVSDVRENGESMPGQQERTFMTGEGKELELYPEKAFLQGKGGQAGICDGETVSLSSTGRTQITAEGGIRISGAVIRAETPLEINMYKSKTDAWRSGRKYMTGGQRAIRRREEVTAVLQ